MRISHEAVSQALSIQGRGARRRELTACLRAGQALRVPRARRRGRGQAVVGPEILISKRPAEVEDRAGPGHWEGALISGRGSSALGTVVERTTRFTMLLHLPRQAEHGRLRVKNGPALAGQGAEAVRDAITSTIATLPDPLRRSLTWDQGAEMAQHATCVSTADGQYSSATPVVRGSGLRTNTPTACGVSPSPKGLTSVGTALATSLLSRPHATADRGSRSVGGPPPKSSTTCYAHTNEDVLRRPLESGLYTGLHRAWPEAIVVYFQGLPSSRDGLFGWQVEKRRDDDRDLRLVDAALASLRDTFEVDNARIYATGFSNGANFTYLLWAERPAVFAAFAPVAGRLRPSVQPTRPKPILHVGGVRDGQIRFTDQQDAIATAKRVDGVDGPGVSCGGGCTLFTSWLALR